MNPYESIDQLAWECGFEENDVPKLEKLIEIVRFKTFIDGFEFGRLFEQKKQHKDKS